MDNQINSENIDRLKAAALDAPIDPGVYIMKDKDGQIIYIGKAKHIKNRIKTYFTGAKDVKTATLLKRVFSFETIIVKNEYEALLLENTLIKQHSPRYNISLKDGKTYPIIRITNEDYPRVFKTRNIIQDKSQYFGPFPDGQAVTAMMELIDKLFPLRKCKKVKKKGPCMYYHIGRCMAPCCGKISIDDYALHVQSVKKMLSGETDSLIIDLTSKMHDTARDLNFEEAAKIRNTIKAIESLAGEDSSVVDLDPQDRDYIAWALEGVLATFTVFSMRSGKMTGRELFRTRSAADEQESLELFITSYYGASKHPPLKIFFQNLTQSPNQRFGEATKINEGLGLIQNWFKEQFGYEPELLIPYDKHHEVILSMAKQNAAEDLRKRLKERGVGPALDELTRVLNLGTRPYRIEGFDIAQLDGKYPVASLISFKNGVPDRKNYRYFKLRTVIGIVDDYAAMREVVRRRYSRLIREEKELPNLILIDGGIGQVNAAKSVLDDLGITNCALLGLAEREEEIWLPKAKEPIVLPRQSEALKVLQHVRDECHRFATDFNQKLRSKDLFFQVLESVEGIGPKRAALIIKTYESMENIAAADILEMSKNCNISEEAARAVRAVVKLTIRPH